MNPRPGLARESSATRTFQNRSESGSRAARRSLLLSAALAALFLLTGCPYANPRTEVSFDPIWHTVRFHDSKDNDIEVKGFEFNTDTKTFKLESLTIRNNASDVRRANVEQIKAQTEQVQAITAMITQQTQILASMAQSIMPWIKPATSTGITIPGVGGITTATTPAPTTRPANP